jgi:hypothetical protein
VPGVNNSEFKLAELAQIYVGRGLCLRHDLGEIKAPQKRKSIDQIKKESKRPKQKHPGNKHKSGKQSSPSTGSVCQTNNQLSANKNTSTARIAALFRGAKSMSNQKGPAQ